MADEIAVGIGTIIVLGVVAQLVAKRLGLPAILFLLVAGVVAGPALGLVDSDEIFGDALFPIVNLGVGLLLFQGGMELDFRKLSDRSVLPRLLTIGVVATAVLATLAIVVLFDFSTGESAILGAVLIVSGPTVVIPLLESARVKQPVDGILRAEGIFIDPIGAAIGYVTLQVVLASNGDDKGLLVISAVGIGIGIVLAVLLLAMLRNFLVPDEYEMALGITFAVIALTVADAIASESGFFAATVLGVVLANQHRTTIAPIMRFGETLNVFVIGALFVMLAARVDLSAVWDVAGRTTILVVLLVLVIRPVVVALCTTPSHLTFKERFYLAAIAPRGIVAAATSSLFGITLDQNGEPFKELVPVTFGVIFLTALIVTFGAVPLARVLGLRRPDPTGVAGGSRRRDGGLGPVDDRSGARAARHGRAGGAGRARCGGAGGSRRRAVSRLPGAADGGGGGGGARHRGRRPHRHRRRDVQPGARRDRGRGAGPRARAPRAAPRRRGPARWAEPHGAHAVRRPAAAVGPAGRRHGARAGARGSGGRGVDDRARPGARPSRRGGAAARPAPGAGTGPAGRVPRGPLARLARAEVGRFALVPRRRVVEQQLGDGDGLEALVLDPLDDPRQRGEAL
jgi:NhaP-type Na+/H+ or K+/H+ antiporter